MIDFLKNVIEGNSESPSDICLKSFKKNFKDAINIEWFKKENSFEAVFYKNNLEHIANFSLTGILTEYRQNLPTNFLPEPVKNIVLAKGEIMNAVMRNKGNMLEYEVIIRDKGLERHLLTLSDIGIIKKEKQL